MAPESPIMTVAEVADFFGVSVRTIYRRMSKPKAGELKLADAVHATVGGRLFFVRESVLALAGIKQKGTTR